MKSWTRISILMIVVAIVLSGCATIKKSALPINESPVLTKEQIRALEEAETREAEEGYRAMIEAENKELVKQPKVSNIFVETDIRAALMDVSAQTGINIIPDLTVEGSVSVALKDVPLETALKMVLYPGGYKFRYLKDGNYYIVGRTLPENSNFDVLSQTKIIKTNREAEKVVEQISEHYKPYIQPSKDGNSITLTGPPDVINRIEKDIKMMDGSKRQIEISAKFVIVQWEKGTNLGMQWGDISLDAVGAASFAKGVAANFTSNLTAGLTNFLETRGYKAKVDIMAEPRIVVEDGGDGELKITEEHLFLILSGGGMYYSYFTTKDIQVGITMKVKPFVTRDGMLRLQIQPEVADIVGEREFKIDGGASQKLPIIARRSGTTTIKVENGQTIGIGGLVMRSKKDTSRGIPILSSIPLLGNILFGGSQREKKDIELVIFITPKIIG